MSALQRTYGDFRSDSVSWSTSLSSYLRDELLCCMLHVPLKFAVDDSGGCCGWNIGTHKSIQALYHSAATKKCFALDGQLVLDRIVAREAFSLSRPVCGPLDGKLIMGRKFRQGAPISVSAYGAGYCYLVAFDVGVRSRAARILGPLPFMADVLRLLRVLSVGSILAKWIKIRDGYYHVVAVKVGDAYGISDFFLAGWDILLNEPGAKVGAILEDVWTVMTSRLQKFDLPCLGSNAKSTESIVVVHESSPLVSSCKFDYNDMGPKAKVKCLECGFYVTIFEHEKRCKKSDSRSDDLNIEFSKAWMGDVVHRRDTRLYVLVKSGVSKRDMGAEEEKYVCRDHQATYYLAYDGVKAPARGTSLHSLSTAFEVSYSGEFRRDYINSVFHGLTIMDLPGYLREFAREF